jgi:hypothetical protein
VAPPVIPVLDVLLGGRLHGGITERRASNGHRFVTGTVRVTDKDGAGHFVSIISFSESAITALLSLGEGASVALSGELGVTTYIARDASVRPALSMLVHECLTDYHVMRRRRAIRGTPGSEPLPFDGELPADLTGAA